MTDCDFEFLLNQARDKESEISLFLSRHDLTEEIADSLHEILGKWIFASEAGMVL